MSKKRRNLVLFINSTVGTYFAAWGAFGGADDGASLARLGIGLGLIGLTDITQAIYRLADNVGDEA